MAEFCHCWLGDSPVYGNSSSSWVDGSPVLGQGRSVDLLFDRIWNQHLISPSTDRARLATAGTMADSQRGEELADLERGTQG